MAVHCNFLPLRRTRLPRRAVRENQHFQKTEPFFNCPILSTSQTVRIRADSYGKGYFGASRNGGRVHEGIDLVYEVGNPIFASKSGRIIFAGNTGKGYGQYIEILHPRGLKSRYAHLSSINISEGDWVTQNQIIGKCGKTGNASHTKITPHLHFEIREVGSNKPLDPKQLFSPSIQLT